MVSDLGKRELFDNLKRVPSYSVGPFFMTFAISFGSYLFGASKWRAMAIAFFIAPLLYGVCIVFWKHCVKRITEMTYEIESKLHAAKLKHRKELVLEKTLDSLRSAQVYEISDGYKNIRACLCAGVTVIVSITLQQYVPLLIIVFLVFVTRDESRLHKIIIHVHLAIIADEKDTLEREKARKEWDAFRETPEGKKLFETSLDTSAEILKTYAEQNNLFIPPGLHKCEVKESPNGTVSREQRDDTELSNFVDTTEIIHATNCLCVKCLENRCLNNIPPPDF